MDSVSHFNDRARDYVKYRPDYPPAAIDAILNGFGSREQVLAADVGTIMRGAAAPHLNVAWTDGTAEATGLAAQSIDLVLSAQSFHWFRPAEALREFARVLIPRGRLAIMWNRRSQIDPLTNGYRQAILDVGGESAMERMDFDPAVIAGSGRFTPPERLAWPNLQRLNLDGLIGRAQSASYVPKSGPTGARLIEQLDALHGRHADIDGFVTLVYETEVYRSARV